MIKEYGRRYSATPLSIGENEHNWLERFKTKLSTNEYDTNLLINLTWLEPKDPDLLQWITSNIQGSTKIWLAGTVDGTEWFIHTELYATILTLNCDVEIAGFSPTCWDSWMPKWILENKQYTDEELQLKTDFNNVYLCYNRKPRPHREQLVKQLIDNKLSDYGWITFEQGVFPEIDQRTGMTDQHLHSPDLRFTRPEDLLSLGTTDIWQNSYCVIVSETTLSDPWQLSEKTWKPIMGLRPYLWNAHSGITEVMRRLGFYTPGDLFDNYHLDTNSIEILITQLKLLCQMSKTELYSMWQNQLPMLEHNRKRFIELASN